MAKKINNDTTPRRKWEHVYESDDSISIWKYDSRISLINPYEVEIKYKTESTSKRGKK